MTLIRAITFYSIAESPAVGEEWRFWPGEENVPACSDVLEDTVTRQQPSGFSSFSTLRAGTSCSGGSRSWQRTVNSDNLFVYLFAALPRENSKGVGGSEGRSRVTSGSLQSPAQPCQDTSWRAVVALNQYFLPSRPGLFHWRRFKSGRVLSE